MAPPGRGVNSIDWESLAHDLGTLRPNGGEVVTAETAYRALEAILGRQAIRDAVDHYVSGRPGAELARFVLWQLHPAAAMERCLEIYRYDADLESRRTAVELLRVVADGRGIAWADEFLNDPDDAVQTWGAGLVDQLLWSRLVEAPQAEPLLLRMTAHANPQVRERVGFIRRFLAAREQQDDYDDEERAV